MRPGGRPPNSAPELSGSETQSAVMSAQRPPECPRPLQPPERTGAAAARAAALPLQTLKGAGACVNPCVPRPGVQRWPPVPRGAAAKQRLLPLPCCVLLRSAPLPLFALGEDPWLQRLTDLDSNDPGGSFNPGEPYCPHQQSGQKGGCCEALTRRTAVAHGRELSKPQVLLVSSQIQLQKPNADPHQHGSWPLPSSLVTGCL